MGGAIGLPQACSVALKEWAVTLTALDRGQQVLLLRKGGIHEEGREFRVLHPQFFLYPTYEHQREDLLKPGWHPLLQDVLASPPPPDTILLTHFAQVHKVIEVQDQEKVDALSPFYIWATSYAEKRLHWKPRKPLSVLLVRVFRLAAPQAIPFLPAYAGCKSWVPLQTPGRGHPSPRRRSLPATGRPGGSGPRSGPGDLLRRLMCVGLITNRSEGPSPPRPKGRAGYPD